MRSPLRIATVSFFAAMMLGLFPFAAALAQEMGMSLTVDLKEYDSSGISGTAVLTESTDGGVHVSMTLTGATLSGNHPTHIHTGTCANFDPSPLYPLETVNLSPVNKEGVSETTVPDVDLATLQAGDYVILVHESPEALTTYLICGDISTATVGTAERTPATGETAAHQMPVAGVGFTAFNGSAGTMTMILTGLAAMSASTAITIRWSRK